MYAQCKQSSLGKYLRPGIVHLCVCCIVFYLVCSPHTGWMTWAASSWQQNPCWTLPGCAAFRWLYAVALPAIPERYSVKHNIYVISLIKSAQQSKAAENAVVALITLMLPNHIHVIFFLFLQSFCQFLQSFLHLQSKYIYTYTHVNHANTY